MFSQSVSFVTQSCSTLCNSVNHSTPGLPVHHHLLEVTQTHVHWVGDAIQPSHPLSSPSPPALFPASGSFPMSQLFASGGQSIGVSASTFIVRYSLWVLIVINRFLPQIPGIKNGLTRCFPRSGSHCNHLGNIFKILIPISHCIHSNLVCMAGDLGIRFFFSTQQVMLMCREMWKPLDYPFVFVFYGAHTPFLMLSIESWCLISSLLGSPFSSSNREIQSV